MIKFTTKNKLVAGFSLAIAAVLTCGAAGTVAWFTANRNVSLNYSKVTVTSVASDLKIGYIPLENAIPGERTAVNGDLVVSGDVKLTDASSFKGTAIYRPVWAGQSFNMQAVQYHVEGDEQYYFTNFMVVLENSGDSPVNVFFDGGNSHIKDVDTDEYVVSDFARVSLSKARSSGIKPGAFITDDEFKFMFMDTDPTPIKDEGKWADYTVSGSSHKKYVFPFNEGDVKTGVKVQITDPDGEYDPSFVSAVTRNAEEMSGWSDNEGAGDVWKISFADDLPAGQIISVEYVYEDAVGNDAYGETDVITNTSVVPAGTEIIVTPKGSDVIKSIHTVYHQGQQSKKLLTTDYKQIVENGDLYCTINKQLSIHEDVGIQFEGIDYERNYNKNVSIDTPIAASEIKTISPVSGEEITNITSIKVDGTPLTKDVDYSLEKDGDDWKVTFVNEIASGEVVAACVCKSNDLIDIPETDYYRDVNAEDSPLIVKPSSTTTDPNYFATLGKKEKTYIVVTMWFEGTELAVQNQFLDQSFDLKLAFASMEVEN